MAPSFSSMAQAALPPGQLQPNLAASAYTPFTTPQLAPRHQGKPKRQQAHRFGKARRPFSLHAAAPLPPVWYSVPRQPADFHPRPHSAASTRLQRPPQAFSPAPVFQARMPVSHKYRQYPPNASMPGFSTAAAPGRGAAPAGRGPLPAGRAQQHQRPSTASSASRPQYARQPPQASPAAGQHAGCKIHERMQQHRPQHSPVRHTAQANSQPGPWRKNCSKLP